MNNPNAIAAWVASHLVIAAGEITSTYFHAKLPVFWQQEAVADITAAVLYVGRDGIKGALKRAAAIAKSIWAGTTPAATKASAK